MARPRSNIQPRIVEAARTRFLADGVDGASLREIAREAGTNIGMVVYYFPSKDDLFLAVVEVVYAKIVADLERIFRANATVRERLREALIRFGDATEHEIEVMRLMVREVLLSSTRFKRIVARFMRGHLPLLVSTIADGARNGEFDAGVPMPLLLASVVGLCGLPQFIRRAATDIPVFSGLAGAPGLADATLEILFRAVGGPAAIRPRAGAARSRRRSRGTRAPRRSRRRATCSRSRPGRRA
jgi:AcrR family transcriptional regulator